MAEIVLAALINTMIKKLVSRSSQYPMKNWSETLRKVQEVLEDAEQKQLTHLEVKRWLDDLYDLAYDIEDVVDELATEARSETTTTARTGGKKRKQMKTKIEEISRRLEDIFQRERYLGLNSNVFVGERVVSSSRQTTSLPPTRVVGREKEKKEIVEMLLKPEADSPEVPVITILGMAGIGKTTLAQDVYHDKEVEACFDLRAWVCVSDVFDAHRITRAILGHIRGADYTGTLDLYQLQEKLKEMLFGKKFLLVLDDTWNKDYAEWDMLLRPFSSGLATAGSRILATTRDETVAFTMSLTGSRFHLKELGDNDCLSLLASHALGREDFAEYPHLKESAEQIVKKCGNLPLALKTIAGLLHNKPQQESEWEAVIHRNMWIEESDGILRALLSLPSHLKWCFAYCSIIPKDYTFGINDLVLLWMAQGLLEQPAEGNNKRMEDYGHDCFQELLSRSFFQLSSRNESEFIMHGLINNLAVHVAGERCFRMDDEWDDNRQYKISNRTRHFSFISQDSEVSNKFNVFTTAYRSHTFLPLSPHGFSSYTYPGVFNISNTVLAVILSQMKYLRVLNLRGYRISELPNSIGALKHLRYLNLSFTEIELLPEFVCFLYNLQTLSLNSCINLRELSSSIGCLTNLRHLDLENTPKFEKMPSGISKLTSLQTLSKVIVRRDIGSCSLKDLKDLIHLHGALSIEELQNVTDDRDAVAADLRSKEHLENVKLQWCFQDSSSSSHDSLLEKLQPHCNLKVFHIEGYGGVGFPSWFGGQSMSNVVIIRLHGCSEIIHLPPLGKLPVLKDLVIEGLESITSVGAEFYGGCAEEIAFPSLETLCFSKMTKWNVWSPPVDGMKLFPRLNDLKIDDCQELGSIPTLDLPFLSILELRHCREIWLERLVNLTSLRKMLIKDVTRSTCQASLEEAEFQGCGQLGSLSHNSGISLKNSIVYY